MLEGQLSQLSNEVERLFDEARGRARRELADQLNQSVRRIRQSHSFDELSATLLDAAMPFSSGAAILRIDDGVAHGDKIRGVAPDEAAAFDALELPLSGAPALAGAVESRDPVIAVSTASELSERLVSLFAHPPDGRAHIYPLVVKEHVPALLYCWGAPQGATLEMLAQVTAAVWDTLTVPDSPQPDPEPEPVQLVAIAPAPAAAVPPAPAPAPVSAWDALAPEDQALHLRAQRFARVAVSDMRLSDGAAVQSGRTHRNLYGALRSRIDAARESFRHQFFSHCSNMVDYIHVEMVRTLAHDDADLLGKDYPGPLA
jgi:hypothetical protein